MGGLVVILLLQVVVQAVEQHIGASGLHLLGPELVVPRLVEELGDGGVVGVCCEFDATRHEQEGAGIASLAQLSR